MVASSAEDYQLFKVFLEDACGILLGDNKQYLVASRLNRLMQQNEIQSLSELVDRIKLLSQRSLKEAVIDAMTTNETLWFRDSHPFDVFKNQLLPEFQRSHRGSIRIWSAACSSGQEPYSLSMMVEELRADRAAAFNSPVEIIATDLSSSMLEACRQAEYDELSLGRGLSQQRRQQFFDTLPNGLCKVKPLVSQRVKFKQLNLLDRFSGLGTFDAVFCRNVLIYFSSERKIDILRRIHSALKPGGYLVLGASEGLTGVSDCYEMVHCNPGLVYRAI